MFALVAALLAFTVAVLWNALAARGTQLCAEGNRWRAAWVDLAIGVLALGSFYLLVETGWWLAPFELVGGFVGTLVGTRAPAGS